MQKTAIGRNGKKRWTSHERISGQIKRISGGCSVSWNFVSDTCNSGEKETINETNTAIEEKSEDLKEGAWQEQIQARLQNMLNESEGAGETKVFLTFENSWENVVEKDENQTVFQKMQQEIRLLM